jgi:hypothetical protein
MNIITRTQIRYAGQPISYGILHAEWEWRKIRNQFIKLEPICQLCAAHKKLQVHHIFPYHLWENLRYEEQNLITLCVPCHFAFGHFGNWKDSNPDLLELVEHVHTRREPPSKKIAQGKWSAFDRDPDFVSNIKSGAPAEAFIIDRQL